MKTETKIEVIKELDSEVLSVIGNGSLEGFQKAYTVAEAIGKLSSLLTKEYMAPIMALQGNRLGFRTDKDKNGGYPEAAVKNCLIEAVLMGVQPVGNQFNIIAGNCYITKEGFGYMLKNYPGLYYKITPDLPRINKDRTSAAITMNISYSQNKGTLKTEALEIPIRVNSGMGTDAIIGKADRKARAWLYNTITGCDVSDGEISDLLEAEVVPDPEAEALSKEIAQAIDYIDVCEEIGQLESVRDFAKDTGGDLLDAFMTKEIELNNE